MNFQGGTFEQQANDPVLKLVGSGTYRDIPTSLVRDYTQGRISQEEALAKIQGTPIFNPASGPVVNGVAVGTDFKTNPDLGTGFTAKGVNYAMQPITSEAITPTSPIPYVSPPPIVPTSTAGVGGTDYTKNPDGTVKPETPLALTKPETQAQDLFTRLQALNERLTGKPSFQAQKEAELGVAEKLKTVNDLTGQLNSLKAEAQSIPLQAAGVNVNAQMLGAQQRELLAQNAIKTLSTGALLSAAQGNLALAQDLVDRAVKAEFAPLEAEIEAKKANLDLIMKSPDYTVAEKNRAEAQKLLQEARQNQLDQQKEDRKNIYSVALEIAKNGADAVTLSSVLKSKSPADAIKKAGTSLTKDKMKSVDYSAAQTFVTDNPSAPYEQLLNGILQNTNLTSTEASTLLSSMGKKKETNALEGVRTSIQKAKDLGFTRDQAEQSIKDTNKVSEIPQPIQDVLNEIYGQKAPSTAVWWNPLTWF